jgi:hypothetical protein
LYLFLEGQLNHPRIVLNAQPLIGKTIVLFCGGVESSEKKCRAACQGARGREY